jgi:hypothetical protein
MIAASLIKQALATLPKTTTKPEKDFVQSFYKQIPNEDIASLEPQEIADIAQRH